jgi:putative SOS response-associated peptidase YedK
MAGQFTLTWNKWRRVADGLGINAEGLAASYRPRSRFNIAPPDQHFIITAEFERRKALRARWGLVNRWAKNATRASHASRPQPRPSSSGPVFTKPSSSALHRARDGLDEWIGQRRRQPLWIRPRDGNECHQAESSIKEGRADSPLG